MIAFLLFFVALVGLGILLDGMLGGDITKAVVGIVVTGLFGYAWIQELNAPPPPPTPAEITAKAQREKEDQEARTPKLMSEADGCKVYSFWDRGYKHYFTKCDNGTVTTDAARSVRSGKTTKTVIETIKTN